MPLPLLIDELSTPEGMKPCMKRPIQVEAVQINEPFTVKTLEGPMRGNPGDYLMRGIDGEYYPCAQDIFERTYDFVNETEEGTPV